MTLDDLLSADREDVLQALEDCVRYEAIYQQWWDEEDGHLPTEAELDWVERHRQTCATGIHSEEH